MNCTNEKCGTPISAGELFCSACGTPASEPPRIGRKPVALPWLSVLLALVCLGQVYNSEWKKVGLFTAAAVVTVVITPVVGPIGPLLWWLLWAFGIVDAYLVASRRNKSNLLSHAA